MNGNDLISWVLRSPFHGLLSNGMMLITVTGRRTGKKITLPVGYYRENGCLWVLTSRNRTWWKNLRDGADVNLLLKHKRVNAHADVEVNEKAVENHLCEYLHHIPQAAKSMKIRVEDGKLNPQDVASVAKGRLFVRLELASEPGQ